MVIGSGLRAPPSTLGSIAKSKTPENIPPSMSKRKEKVDTSKKCKVASEDIPTSSPPPQPQTVSHPDPSKETATSSEPNQVDKDEELFALLNQLPEKAGMSPTFIDRFTSEDGWERMKRRSAKVAFGIMRMLANVSIFYFLFSTHFSGIDVLYFQTAATAVLMHDPVLECLEKAEKVEEITQAFEDSEKARKEEKRAFDLERQQLLEGLAKEKFEKEKLEEKIKELEKTISDHPDRMKEATTETTHKAVEEFKATEVKELEDKASDIASSTIIYNIFCEHPDLDFSILGEDVIELVQSWKEDEATKTRDGGASTSA
ncbi:hypothetical protein PanWU01x14_103330 [Parasponia andersonii]|uniref:Uncharacterized protein n=1 Tax=Parasponia andersonii TaxID=3476 RepID=A0A2P5D224_PARAD|nr:hypothetical protein PanWU01x14_103330 [Parasponia andersonii]